MAVKVQKLDANGHADGEAVYETGWYITVDDGVLTVKGRSTNGHPGNAIATYQKGFWMSADVVKVES